MNTNPKYYQLASDLRISRVLTGLWQIADMQRDGRQLNLESAAQSMTAYVEAGFTTFDMADHYGSAEEIAGIFSQKYQKEKKAQFFTKWVPKPGGSTKKEVREAVQKSLDRLQTEQLDLLQYHAWNYADPTYLDDLFYLEELRKEGLVRHLGLTNVDTSHLRMILHSGIKIISNQVCFSLLDQRAAGRMLALCQEYGVSVLAFGVLAGGFLTERWLNRKEPAMDELQTWSQMKYKRFIDVAGGWQKFQDLLRTMDKIARRHKASMANIASRYILDQPGVGGIILGARLSQSAHISENLRLFELSLDKKSRQEIEKALAIFNPIPGDCGDEYRKPPFLTASGDLSHHLDSFPAPYPTKVLEDGRTLALSGTVWEGLAGFSRALRKGDRILVSGTTATHKDQVVGGRDTAAQTHFVIDKIAGALQSLGGRLEDVVRTRVFIRRMEDWEPVARAHGERFGHIQPANTLVQAGLIGEEYLVEMEAEAVVN